MTQKTPNEALRKTNSLVDLSQQQIDPPGKNRVNPIEDGRKRSQKQPGQDLRDPQKQADDAE